MPKSRAGRRPAQLKRAPPPPGKTYFLGIGIDAYQHWPRLRNAVRDVEAIAALLTTDFGLAPEHSTLLLDDQATEERIIHQLEGLADTVTERDSLIIYYAGHGYLHRSIRGFWVPVDAPRRKIPRLIRNSTIRDYIGDIPSLHTLLISDSCFSGSLFVRGERREELEVDELATLPSRWAITSGRLDEPVTDGPKGGHSPFARSILDVLSMPSRDRITANFLYEQVREQTVANGHQMPDGGPLAGVAHKRGQYVFRRFGAMEPAIETGESLDELTKLRQALAEKEALLEQLRQSGQASATIKAPVESPAPVRPTPHPPKQAEGNPDMIFIPGGTFQMGDVMGDNEYDDEKPVHPVTLSDFYLGRYAVTFAEYDAFCEATGREKPGDQGWGRDRRPVINVSWYDAVAYCNWRSEQEGYTPYYGIEEDAFGANPSVSIQDGANGYRLPTEAEWEYAARQGGEKVRFGNGKDVTDPQEINFLGSQANKKTLSIIGGFGGMTVPVGSLNSPNKLGLHDMSGNAGEWCEDDRYDNYEKAPTDGRAWMDSPRGGSRVVRGGSWTDRPRVCRVAYRGSCGPSLRHGGIGFRLARTPRNGRITETEIESSEPIDEPILPPNTLLGKEALGQSGQAVTSSKAPIEAKVKTTDKQPRTEENPDMIFIPGGTFEMGDVLEDHAKGYDKPVHQVSVSDFYLGRFTVTFDEYDIYCEATGQKKPSDSGWGRGQRPVINVSWYDAVSYCNWLSEQKGFGPTYSIKGEDVSANWGTNGYRLPTEAEWEYAARQGGERVRFGNGKNLADPAEINFYCSEQYKESYSKVGTWLRKTIPVGSLNSPNRLGLNDMSGNVSEWCWDWWGNFTTGEKTNPRGPENGDARINRGGSFRKTPKICRSSSRGSNIPKMRSSNYGFRLARNA